MSTQKGEKQMRGLTMTGICFTIVGMLVVIWGATLYPIDLSSPDFMSFATGGLILTAMGLCMVRNLPSILSVAGIWLAALAIMLYLYSLPNTDLIIKVIGFVPVVALAIWLTFKFWK